MPKEITGNSRRTPPEAAAHSDIEQWLGRLMPNLQPIVRDLDEIICAEIPDLIYAVKYKRAFYGQPELGWLMELAPYDVSANVLFLGGADFDVPPPLGSVGRTRYVKIKSAADVQQPELLEWIKQAGRTPGWK